MRSVLTAGTFFGLARSGPIIGLVIELVRAVKVIRNQSRRLLRLAVFDRLKDLAVFRQGQLFEPGFANEIKMKPG